jgi:uncharacterized protein (TIGR02145 family)
MNIKFLNLLLIGSIVASVILTSCEKDEEVVVETPTPEENTLVTGTFTDSRDSKTYAWVEIGNQTWMSENLAYDKDTNCRAYNDNSSNIATYGLLYNWDVAQTVAPAGWHLPTLAEWQTLITYLKDNGYSYDGVTGNPSIAKSLATSSGWDSAIQYGSIGNTDYPEYMNKTGFSAVPGGMGSWGVNLTTYEYEFNSSGMGGYCNLWSATEYDTDTTKANYIQLRDAVAVVTETKNLKRVLFSVRCVKD